MIKISIAGTDHFGKADNLWARPEYSHQLEFILHSNLQPIGIRMRWIHDLICPEKHDTVFSPGILNGMSVAGRDIDNLYVLLIDLEVVAFYAIDLPQGYPRLAFDKAEFLHFCVVIVVASLFAWPCGGDENLSRLF